jgi:zinc finger protein
MEFSWETVEIPFFGEAMLISGLCSCGFRHSDTLLLSQKEPARYTLEVTEIGDLNARVIRSSSGTVRVPELGVTVEPGEASESYISNVEGVLGRITEIVEFATRVARAAGDLERARRGEEILENIRLALMGRFKLTFTIEDPLGNSAIASDKAVRAPLKDEEIAELSWGMVILDRLDASAERRDGDS